MKCRVLFVGATDGLCSPMAEAMLRWLDSEHFEARSAGTICGELHPLAVQVLKEIGIDLGQATPKSVQQSPDEEFHQDAIPDVRTERTVFHDFGDRGRHRSRI